MEPSDRQGNSRVFIAEAHSWILVDDELFTGAPLDAQHHLMPSSTRSSSPCQGSQDELSSNASALSEATSDALALSEILSSAVWPAPISDEPLHTPFNTNDSCSTAAAPACAKMVTSESPYMNATPACVKLAVATQASQAERSYADAACSPRELAEEKQPLKRTSWRGTLTLASVLLASHTAVLLIGMIIGRQQSAALSEAEQAAIQSVTFARRFSSGADGVHARLCLA